MGMNIDKAIDGVIREYTWACVNHKTFSSAHEGYAVLLEEMDELKAEIWKKKEHRDIDKMRREATQVGAMALRFLTDVCESPKGSKL
jgi:hypothetical protein